MSDRVPALTGIRALAAVSVCLTHAAFWTGHYTDDYLGRLSSRFEVGVTIFFVLSGYLLFRPWVRVVADGATQPAAGRYLWHRARRILPAYWITVLAVYGLGAIHAPPDRPAGTGPWTGLFRNLTLTQVYGYGHLQSGLTQMWSLAAEVVYYLVLPVVGVVLTVVVCRRRWRPDLMLIGLAALFAIGPLWTIVVAGGDGIDPTARLWAPAFVDWFVAGMALAVCARLIRRWPVVPSVAVGVVAFLVSGTAIAGEPTITPLSASATIAKHLLYLVVALGLIGPLVVGEGASWWPRFFASRPMVWLGEISYEFFLVHLAVLSVVTEILGYRVFSGSMILAFLLTTAVSIPIAWLLHRATAPLWRARTPKDVVVRG